MKHYKIELNGKLLPIKYDSIEAGIKAGEHIRESGVLTDNFVIVEINVVYDSDPNHRYRSDHDGLLHDTKK